MQDFIIFPAPKFIYQDDDFLYFVSEVRIRISQSSFLSFMYCVEKKIENKEIICGQGAVESKNSILSEGFPVRIISVNGLLNALSLSTTNKNVLDSTAIKIQAIDEMDCIKIFKRSIRLFFPYQKRIIFITKREILFVPFKEGIKNFSGTFATIKNMRVLSCEI